MSSTLAMQVALDAHKAMYSVRTDKQQAAGAALYDDLASFDDPLMEVKTKHSVSLAFQSLKLLFSRIDGHVLSVTESTPNSTGIQIVVVDANLIYTTRFIPLPLTLRTLTKYTVDTNAGKVLQHEDIWSVKDMIRAIPLLGPLYTDILCPLNWSLMEMMMKTLIHDHSK